MAEQIDYRDIQTTEQLDQWLNQGGNVNFIIPEYGIPIISYFTSFGLTSLVKYLISKGGDYNARDLNGSPPFVRICANGHEDLFDYFVNELHVNINDTYEDGTVTALSSACIGGQINIIKKLLSLGVTVNNDVIFDACCNRDIPVEVFDHLIIHGANPNVQNWERATPLHKAVQCGNMGVIRRLLELNVNTTVKGGRSNKTALELADPTRPNYNEIVALFTEFDVK